MIAAQHLAIRAVTILIALLALPVLAGCQAVETTSPTAIDPALISTRAAETVIARFTQAAGSQTPSPSASATPIPSATPTLPPTSPPSDTPVPTETATETPQPTFTPSATPLPCNQAQFLQDVTIPDNAPVSPGAGFIKTWQLRNVGSCIWNTSYELVFVSGEPFGPDLSVPLSHTVYPGDVANISTYLTAPTSPGFHRAGFMLRADDGSLFGVGTEGFGLFWVQVQVIEPNPDFAQDFATNLCLAEWESPTGMLPCPGDPADPAGFVALLQNPRLENRRENEPAIWSQPMAIQNGWIRGTFPPVRIGADERFLVDIGCLDGYPDCDVVFQLNYRIPGGVTHNLGEWHEVSDGEITRVELVLTGLSGREVEFIFSVLANGSPQDDAAFWLAPHLAP